MSRRNRYRNSDKYESYGKYDSNYDSKYDDGSRRADYRHGGYGDSDYEPDPGAERPVALSRMIINLVMAIASVVPMVMKIYELVPFTYETNDDSALVQVLDGSYTGVPDGHSIFVRYPLSGLIAKLYERKAEIHFFGLDVENVNWYVATIVIISAIAMTAVLFQMLNYFGRFRLAICIGFDFVFMMAWLPHFVNMTFSTAAAFMGCMAMLFFGFLRFDNSARIWNILLLAGMLISSYCLREQCFLMVLPIIAMEAVLKFNIRFINSLKPWACIVLTGLLVFGAIVYDGSQYHTPQWKAYFEYNQMRAHMQDYVGYPDYEENEKFYKSNGISEADLYAMEHYTYSMVSNYTQKTLKRVYDYQVAGEEQVPLKEAMKAAYPKARTYFEDDGDCNPWLILITNYVWIIALAAIPVGMIFFLRTIRRRIWSELASIIAYIGGLSVVVLEWTYLAVDARFPPRVEEAIRLFTLCVGIYLLFKALDQWSIHSKIKYYIPSYDRDSDSEVKPPLSERFDFSILAGVGIVVQLALLFYVYRSGVITTQFDAVDAAQVARYAAKSDKFEVIQYCGDNMDNLYVLDTSSVTGGTRPDDDLHQGNWFMSGSWMNLSPIYYEKLSKVNTKELSHDFLARDNVYYITKGEKNVAKRMGYDDKNDVTWSVVDRFRTSNGTEYVVNKIY